MVNYDLHWVFKRETSVDPRFVFVSACGVFFSFGPFHFHRQKSIRRECGRGLTEGGVTGLKCASFWSSSRGQSVFITVKRRLTSSMSEHVQSILQHRRGPECPFVVANYETKDMNFKYAAVWIILILVSPVTCSLLLLNRQEDHTYWKINWDITA